MGGDTLNIGRCTLCGMYDLKSNMYRNPNAMFYRHRECASIQRQNSYRMRKEKTELCAFTGLPFETRYERRPEGDHNHDTLLYRGHIWSSVNRLEGALKSVMALTGWSMSEVFIKLEEYLDKPGKDIGLKPYPSLGFKTQEEAIEKLSTL